MKKIKNKFILVIILFIVSILAVESYKAFTVLGEGRGSYVVLIDWEATLNNLKLGKNIKLEINKKELLNKDDELSTIWEESLAMVKWWDWSITRVWWNSDLIIEQVDIEEGLLNIKIAFKLEKWKTWSDVISFIWDESYFHQTFSDTTAAVRWTIFEVNLENNYVYVDKHEVILTKDNWEEKIIWENKPFNIDEFIFIDLLKFINDIKDIDWRALNLDLDKEFYKALMKSIWDIEEVTTKEIDRIEKYVKNIDELTNAKKNELYNEALSEYQKINFISTDDIENYRKKLELKTLLIELAPSWDKKSLLLTSIYDLKDLTIDKQYWELKNIIWIFSNNMDELLTIDINLLDYINIDVLQNWLEGQFTNEFNKIKNFINSNMVNINDNNPIDWIKKPAEKTINNIKLDIEKLNLEGNNSINLIKDSVEETIKNIKSDVDNLNLEDNEMFNWIINWWENTIEDITNNIENIRNLIK